MAKRFFEDKSITEPYAQFRPIPPQELVDHVIGYLKEKYTGKLSFAVDVGCGSGQATVLLAPHFEEVLGTDVSPEQILQGTERKLANIEFKVAPAENLPVPNASCQLVTVCTAIHWFDIPKFFQEAERVLCPNGVLAAFGHGILRLRWPQNPSKDAALNKLIDDTVYVRWKDYAEGAIMVLIEGEYQDLVIPMRDVKRCRGEQGFFLRRDIKLVDLPKYFQSMSPYRRMVEAEGEEAGVKLGEEFVQAVLNILGDEVAEVDKNDITLVEEQKYFLVMARK